MTALQHPPQIWIHPLEERQSSLLSTGTEGNEVFDVIADALRHLGASRATLVEATTNDDESYRHVTLPVDRTIKVRLSPGGRHPARHVEFEDDER